MLATGPLLTPLARPVLAKVDVLQDETQRNIVPRLTIVAINRETPSYYSNNNNGSVTLAYTIDNAPPDQGITMWLGGWGAKTFSRGQNTSFTGIDEQYGIRNIVILDTSIEAKWFMQLDLVNQRIIWGGKSYYVGQQIQLPRPLYIGPKLLVNSVTRESPSNYSNSNDATASFTYYLSEGPADQGIEISAGPYTKVVARGSAAVFTGLDEHTQNTLSVFDICTGGSWLITLDIVNKSVIYNNKRYYPGDYIEFNALTSSNNNGAVQLTISGLRSGIASVVCNGITYEPINKPPLATRLAQQTFAITNLDGNRTTFGYVIPRVAVGAIVRETASQYSNANNASATLTFYVENVPAEQDQGIIITLRQSIGNITKTTSRGTAVTFTGLDEHYGNASVIMTDVASGVSWTMNLNVAQQRVTYGTGSYTQGQTIALDTASVKFKIPSPYAISVYSPYNNKTYSLSASIGFKRLTEPSNVNKSSITHKNVLYKQGSFIRLIAN